MSGRSVAAWTVANVIEALAAKAPSPAAGSAAALSLAQGASLGVKVVRVSATSQREAPARRRLETAESELLRVGAEALPKFDEDRAAVESVMRYLRESPRVGDAPDEARRVPLTVLLLATEGLGTLRAVVPLVKDTLICDAGASASLMWSAAEIAHSLVTNNARWLEGGSSRDADVGTTREALAAARSSYDVISGVVRQSLDAAP